MGVFEKPNFSKGTKKIGKALSDMVSEQVKVVVGGGDTAAALELFGLDSNMTHISTGGGACLNYLAVRLLPGIASLEYSAEKFKLKISQTITDN